MTSFDLDAYLSLDPDKVANWHTKVSSMPAGQYVINNTIPPGMLIIDNLLSPMLCDEIAGECRHIEGERHTTGGVGAGGAALRTGISDQRTSDRIDVADLSKNVSDLVRGVFTGVVAPHYRADIEWYEQPEILRYSDGAEFKLHADSEVRDPTTEKWRRVLDRDLSILLYLNNDFEGGEIEFPVLEFAVRPKRGMLIAFPSGWTFAHAAKPVTSGVRFALVSWAAIRGTPRVHAEPPMSVVRL